MEIIIRKETAEDYFEVECMTKRAFWNVNMPGCDEHYFVHMLRKDKVYIPELTRVAELNGKIVGVIMYSKAKVRKEDKEYDVITFGPLCVEPKYQKMGIGGKLMHETFRLAKENGHKAIIITGVPTYYPKYGFVTCDHFGITFPDGTNTDALMAYELNQGAFRDMAEGRYFEPDVINGDVSNQVYMREVELYDQKFPQMEKRVLPGQWRK